MRKLVVTALVAASLAASAGTATAGLLGPECLEGYVGVVVDDHNVCTNIIKNIKTGG